MRSFNTYHSINFRDIFFQSNFTTNASHSVNTNFFRTISDSLTTSTFFGFLLDDVQETKIETLIIDRNVIIIYFNFIRLFLRLSY